METAIIKAGRIVAILVADPATARRLRPDADAVRAREKDDTLEVDDAGPAVATAAVVDEARLAQVISKLGLAKSVTDDALKR